MKRNFLLTTIVLLVGATAIAGPRKYVGDKADPLGTVDPVQGMVPYIGGYGVQVVEFWATWCPPCESSVPYLSKLQNYFQDDFVHFIGISDERREVVENYVAKRGSEMTYAVGVDSNRYAHSDYMEAFGVETIPHAFIVYHGNVVWHGHPSTGEMADKIKDIVSDPNY